jgi:hypothetical protein
LDALRLEDNEILLTSSEVADLYSTSIRTVQNWIKIGKLNAVNQISNKGRGGITLMIPLSAVDDRRQRKFWKKNKGATPVQENVGVQKRLDEFTADERVVIQEWIDAINAWQEYRSGYKRKMDADELWVSKNMHKYKSINISVDSLYRKWKALRADDYDGLVEKRGKWAKGTNSIPEVAWELFKYYYLDESQHPVSKCVQYVTWYLEKEMPELLQGLPTYYTFYRAIQTIPLPVVKLFREGDKAYEDAAAPYISRVYDELEVNEVWVADAHTFDVMTIIEGKETIHRMTVVAFADVRSKLITGWHVTNNTSSEAVLLALRKGINEYGIPRYILVDNGTEFLCHDIGGRGHRQRKSTKDVPLPPGVFKRLGIEMWNAQVRNAKAKIIERIFREFKENFSRLMQGFCGGNPLERPERLKKTLKTRRGIQYDSEFIQNFDTYIRGMYNETKSNGLGMYGRAPIDVYTEEFFIKRTASEEDLVLMLMRSTKMQTVSRKGVQIKICGESLYYWTPEFVFNYEGRKQVYVRYDPDNLTEVRVYDEHDKYICNLPMDRASLEYGDSKDKVKECISETRKVKKLTKEYYKNSGFKDLNIISELELMLWKANRNIEERQNKPAPEAKILEVVRANEDTAVAYEQSDTFREDLDRMVMNSNRNAI